MLGRRAYFDRAVDAFFDSLHRLHIHWEHFKQEIPIVTDFSEATAEEFHRYLRRLGRFPGGLSRADRIAGKLGFSIWENQSYGRDFFEAFGLTDLPEGLWDIAIYFIWYFRGVAAGYRTLRVVRGKRYSYFAGVKAVAGKLLAEELGLGHLLTAAEFCRLEFEDGQVLFGVKSPAAPGCRMVDSDVVPTGSLQRELMALNVLDAICFQTDHGPNNYNVAERDGVYTVCAFDNDNPNTFLPLPAIGHPFSGCAPLVGADGLLNRPYFDRELLTALRNTDIRSLKKKLKTYLNPLQIAAVTARIKILRKMLEKSLRNSPNLVISGDEWNEETLAAELSGRYGRTYLTRAMERKE